MVDGQELTALAQTQRTPNPYDPRPETKYGEAFAVAVVACSIGLNRVTLSTVSPDGTPREAPDLLLTAEHYDGIGVEVVRVDQTAAARVRLYEVQEQVVRMLQRHPELKSSRNLRFTLDFAKTGTLSDIDVDRLTKELQQFYRTGGWKLLQQGHCTTVFSEGTVAHRSGMIVEVNQPTYSTFLGFARADEMTPYEAIIESIERKRQLDYTRDNPLWLVVEVADPRGPFQRALDAVRLSSTELTPFARVFVHDGSGHVLSLPNQD
jgi:hypothetical protein